MRKSDFPVWNSNLNFTIRSYLIPAFSAWIRAPLNELQKCLSDLNFVFCSENIIVDFQTFGVETFSERIPDLHLRYKIYENTVCQLTATRTFGGTCWNAPSLIIFERWLQFQVYPITWIWQQMFRIVCQQFLLFHTLSKVVNVHESS